MSAAPDDLSDLERWAVDDGFMSREEVLARREPASGLPAVEVGRGIIAALRERGLVVRLGEDGRPRVGPRDLVDEASLAALSAHRGAVLVALRLEVAS